MSVLSLVSTSFRARFANARIGLASVAVDEGCSVCKFLAQAKQPGILLEFGCINSKTVIRLEGPPREVPKERFTLYTARAPPAHI